jgi:arylsulfatase A
MTKFGLTSRLSGFVRWILIVSAVFVFNGSAISAERAGRPNIVLIVADDLGYGELGCYGQKWIKTPRLDELAREGMRFTQFYSGAPVCAPARCMLMTGKHSGHAAIRDNRKPGGMKQLREQYDWEFPGQTPLPASEVTIASLLKERGYATGATGKWGLGQVGNMGDPARHGFDLFYGYYCQVHAHNHYPKFLWRNAVKETLAGNNHGATGETHSQSRFAEEAMAFIREHRDEPFFLYLPFTIPHLAIQVPDAELKQYKGTFPESPYEHRSNYHEHPSPRAGYAAMVSYMDRNVGQIVDLVEELGLTDDTLFLFTSDNGPTYRRLGGADSDFFDSSSPLRGRKGTVYEGGIRVPLIARWPGKINAGTESDHAAAFWDVLPTLCELTQKEPPKEIDGISFAPTLLRNGKQKTHKYLYWEFPAYGVQQAVRFGNWKAVRHGLNKGDSDFELYDLSTDVAESHNVAAEHSDVLDRVKEIVKEAHTPSKKFPLLAEERDGKGVAAR